MLIYTKPSINSKKFYNEYPSLRKLPKWDCYCSSLLQGEKHFWIIKLLS